MIEICSAMFAIAVTVSPTDLPLSPASPAPLTAICSIDRLFSAFFVIDALICSRLEETTSSLEQMSASITKNAENSRSMEQMAVKGAGDAGESGKSVGDTVTAMANIAEQISIIEEIAYQTNL